MHSCLPCPHHALNKSHRTLHSISVTSPSEGEKPRQDPGLTRQESSPSPARHRGLSPHDRGASGKEGVHTEPEREEGKVENLRLLTDPPRLLAQSVPGQHGGTEPPSRGSTPDSAAGFWKGWVLSQGQSWCQALRCPRPAWGRAEAGQGRPEPWSLLAPPPERPTFLPAHPHPQGPALVPDFVSSLWGALLSAVASAGNAPHVSWRTHTEGPFSLGS